MELHVDAKDLWFGLGQSEAFPFGRWRSRLRLPMKFHPGLLCEKCAEVGLNQVSDLVGTYLLCDSCGHIAVKR